MLPRLLQIGPFTVYSFGLTVFLGFFTGLEQARRLARRRGLDGDALAEGALWILAVALLGARLLYVALNWKSFSQDPFSIGALWKGGMSFHGGAAGGILMGLAWVKRKGLPGRAMADAAAPGLAIGYAIGRVGCFLNGCCFGGPTTLPWGVHFPDSPTGEMSHPVQLYATLIALGLWFGLRRFFLAEHREGQVMAAYLIGYSAYRFLIEFLRAGVTAQVAAGGLTEAQWLSLAILVAGTVWFLRLGKTAPVLPALSAVPSGQ